MWLTSSTPVISASGVFDLAVEISKIDLTGQGPPDLPWGSNASQQSLTAAVDWSADVLPLPYLQAYVSPVRVSLGRLAAATEAAGGDDPAETVLGAIYDHAPGSVVATPLRRFEAFISDLWDSFLSREKRCGLKLPLIEKLPPLAAFRHDGSLGPYTFTPDVMQLIAGASVGVVSLPSTYRDHPLIWGSIAHETGGHDVVHADPNLLTELADGVSAAILGSASSWGSYASAVPVVAALWSHWIDEATADVFGILNIGPEFELNLVPWLMAFRAELGQTSLPHLLTTSGPVVQGQIDVHPTDILRIDLAIGVINALTSLSPATKSSYISVLQQVAEVAAGTATTVGLTGYLPVSDSVSIPLDLELPLPLMRGVAAAVGAWIATTPLAALNNVSIQAVETWDDVDEAAAITIASRMNGRAAGAIGDPAAIMAGATLAAINSPLAYEDVNQMLDHAFDVSIERDPLWSTPAPHNKAWPSKSA
jgi:hypothetical protein